MKQTIKWLGVIGLVLILATGVYFAAQCKTSEQANQVDLSQDMQTEKLMANKKIEIFSLINQMKIGDIKTTELYENMTTGYEWVIEVSGDQNAISYTFDYATSQLTDVTTTDETGLVCGAGSNKTLTVTGLKKGQATLTMKLVRPWQTENEDPIQEIIYEVEVFE